LGAVVVRPPALTSPSVLAATTALSSFAVLELLAGLAAVRERGDDLAEAADLAALLADALGAGVLVVVFVGI
jgi:hypothetical protein